jgi:glyoxylase-like metal-dependent hydrolase (beta-lactamase superfamily II)
MPISGVDCRQNKNQREITMPYFQIKPGLFLIPLEQKLEGFDTFISSWLYRSCDLNFLVDPGPLYSIEILKKTLDELEVSHLDYILLTHIHIDHAGGTGKLLESFPEAKVICHPQGIPHLINPAKLWEGSLTVLGEIAQAYGEIVPVAKGSLVFERIIKKGSHTIEVIETPGHAPHHLSYIFPPYLFAGEVAGVYQSLNDKIYLRPATPPKFELEISLASLEKLITKQPEIICFGHYGWNEDGVKILSLAKNQLELWTKVVKEESITGKKNWENNAIERLMKEDHYFSNYRYLTKDIHTREQYFILNAIRGIVEYVNRKHNPS